MMSNVTVLRQPRIAKPATRKATRLTKRQRFQHNAAYGVLTVAGTLTALSGWHLATGTELVTHCSTAAAYAMAVGVDGGFISLEAAALITPLPAVRKWAMWVGIAALALSACMNALAFCQGAQGPAMVTFAIFLGAIIPLLIYAQVHVAALMLKGK